MAPRCKNGTRRNKKTGNCEPTTNKGTRCKNGTRRNKKTGNCEPTTNKGTLKRTSNKIEIKNVPLEEIKNIPLEKENKLPKSHKMNKNTKKIKVNEYEIQEILYEIFTSEYEKKLRYENDILTKGVMAYLVKNCTMLTVYRIEDDIVKKVYTIYENKKFSETYNDLYNAVIEAIDFENNPEVKRRYLGFERVKEILHNISKSKKNKKITKREVEDAISGIF